jgi:phosphinothricin acetyltransferase
VQASALIRAARAGDAPAIAAIHNQGIEEREATFETRARSASDYERVLAEPVRAPVEPLRPPFLVAECEGRVVGWARLVEYAARPYYAGVGEASIYLDRDARGRGLGARLLAALTDEADRRGYWKIVGLLFPMNHASVALFHGAGYRDVGTYRRHGRLDGEWRDVLLVERLLGEAARPLEDPSH